MNKAEIIIASQPRAIRGTAGEWTVLCPWHQERSPSCCVNVIKNVFICHGCGVKGRLSKLVAKLQNISYAEAASEIDDEGQYVQEIEQGQLSLPPEYHELPYPGKYGAQALAYLRGRRITEEQIRLYNIGFCAFGKFAQRVIIPVTHHGRLVSYVARDWTGKATTKVRYPSGSQAVLALFGYDRAASYARHVVITEGWADALAVERALRRDRFFSDWASVALGGKELSDEKLLMLSDFDRFTIMLDSDAGIHPMLLRDRLSILGKPTNIVGIHAKDPAEAEEKDILQALR